MLEELKVWGELDIRKSGPQVCIFGIIYTISDWHQSNLRNKK